MEAATVDREGGTVLIVENSPSGQVMFPCQRCGLRYDWHKSSSQSLKMTYCGFMCEKADIGCTIEDLLRLSRKPGGVDEQQKSDQVG